MAATGSGGGSKSTTNKWLFMGFAANEKHHLVESTFGKEYNLTEDDILTGNPEKDGDIPLDLRTCFTYWEPNYKVPTVSAYMVRVANKTQVYKYPYKAVNGNLDHSLLHMTGLPKFNGIVWENNIGGYVPFKIFKPEIEELFYNLLQSHGTLYLPVQYKWANDNLFEYNGYKKLNIDNKNWPGTSGEGRPDERNMWHAYQKKNKDDVTTATVVSYQETPGAEEAVVIGGRRRRKSRKKRKKRKRRTKRRRKRKYKRRRSRRLRKARR